MVFRGTLGVTLGSPAVELLVASHNQTSVAPKVNFSGGGQPQAASIPTGETGRTVGTAFGDGLACDSLSSEVLNSSSLQWSKLLAIAAT